MPVDQDMRQKICRYCRTAQIVVIPDMGGRAQTLNLTPIPLSEDPLLAGWALIRHWRSGRAYVRPLRDLAPRRLAEVTEVLTFHLCAQKAAAWRDRKLRVAGFSELIIVTPPE